MRAESWDWPASRTLTIEWARDGELCRVISRSSVSTVAGVVVFALLAIGAVFAIRAFPVGGSQYFFWPACIVAALAVLGAAEAGLRMVVVKFSRTPARFEYRIRRLFGWRVQQGSLGGIERLLLVKALERGIPDDMVTPLISLNAISLSVVVSGRILPVASCAVDGPDGKGPANSGVAMMEQFSTKLAAVVGGQPEEITPAELLSLRLGIRHAG